LNITRLFVRRPTLVTVFIALVTLAGSLAAFVLVKQQYPNYDVPTIQVLVTYPGASTSEMRDAIVRPLEDQVAGAPDLQSLESAIQPGQATIVARFVLTSDVNSDLVQVQGRVQNAQRQLPNDLQAPQVSIYDPSQAVVVSLVASSSTLSTGALSSTVDNKVVPSLEQIPGVSFVETNGDVTPSLVGLYADGRRQHDLEQQRTCAGRHHLLARSRDKHRHPRRYSGCAERREPAAHGGRNRVFERLDDQCLRNDAEALARRRRRRRHRHLRNAARLRVLARLAEHFARRPKGDQHERGHRLRQRDRGATHAQTGVSRRQLHRPQRPVDLHP